VNYDVHNVTIQGNFLGTDVSGTRDLGNGDSGIQIRSNDNLIGGSNPADRNIISGNNNRGISTFSGGMLTGNVIENNYIGVDATGIRGLGNNVYGIQLYNTDGMRIVDNVISDNDEGIVLRSGSAVHNSVIRGNMIGVGADGTTLLGNGDYGIRIDSDVATNNLIGGSGAGQGNIIAGSDKSGIEIGGLATTSTLILGNFIGTNAAGTLNLGNAEQGILIVGSSGNTIGGVLAGLQSQKRCHRHIGKQ
jgi:parallel beta-helix repeat protein